jgi:endoglucanase
VRRGINLGNAFDVGPDVPRAWAVDSGYLSVIRDAGFDTVRLPVAWSKHAAQTAPFKISPTFFAEIDGVIAAALERELEVVIDVHHYDEVCVDPDAHDVRFLALWAQIGERYAGLPTTVVFELLNEPHGRLAGRRWNQLLADALAVVRDSNPERDVVAGPAHRNTIAGLAELELPDDDRLIVTIHYYLPLSFTHQGARWLPDAVDWLGTRWGSPADRAAVQDDLAAAVAWSQRRGRRLFLGEFGTFMRAAHDDRVAWTTHVRKVADQLDIPWCYWDLATDFGTYDAAARQWDIPLRTALLDF